MGESTPASTLCRTQVQAAKLPASSFRQRGHTYATIQPFEVWDDHDEKGNNQLNWTNLFLWNKFGKTISVTDVEAAGSILTIRPGDPEVVAQVKKIGKTLSDEFSEVRKLIERMKDSSDLGKIQSALQNVIKGNDFEYKFLKINSKIDDLEKSVNGISEITKQIALRFGIKAY